MKTYTDVTSDRARTAHPSLVKRWAVFSVFHRCGETSLILLDDLPPFETFEKAEAKIARIMHPPRQDRDVIGHSDSILTILPVYRLDSPRSDDPWDQTPEDEEPD